MQTETLNLPEPRSAWLLLGDEASYPPIGLYEDAGEDFCCWTVCPHVEIGDTLFFYFVAPRKAVHFIGRAISRPYVDPTIEVTSYREVNRHQWWVDYAAVVEIEPISLGAINDACQERLVLRGRSGKYIRSECANQLLAGTRVIHASDARCQNMALRRIVGRSELPPLIDVNLTSIRDLPSSLLRLESDVEEYIVEPLIRLLQLPRKYRLQRRLNVGRKIADYVVFSGDSPHCVIETKLRTALDRCRNWAASADIRQANGYANNFHVPFIVLDCEEIFCFDRGTLEPRLHFERRQLEPMQMAALREFVVGDT